MYTDNKNAATLVRDSRTNDTELSGWLNKDTVLFEVKIKPYLLKELAYLYETHPKTFRKWLLPFKKDIGNRQGFYYNILQVTTIFGKLGRPTRMIER